jgi:hypothetical protein
VTTLRAIQEVRQQCDHTELSSVLEARKLGLSWTEIAGALGVTRQSAWERWHELDETVTADPMSLYARREQQRAAASNR